MNVLILSASRKVWLVQAFQRALAGTGRVLAADLTRLAPALHVADAPILLPPTDDVGFLDALADVCAEEHVGLVVPTRDGELPVLAGARDAFAQQGVHLVVSSLEAVTTCMDKAAFTSFCLQHGFAVPEPVERPTADDLPLFARPRRGQASADARTVHTQAQLATCTEHVFARVVSAPEYTVDVFLDHHGRAVTAVPRERIVVIGGESHVTRTVEDPTLSDAAAGLCQQLGLVGPASVQAFRTDDEILFIEVNPRFGGASALSFRAGADAPMWLVEEARGVTLASRMGQYQRDLAMLRYGADLFLDGNSLR